MDGFIVPLMKHFAIEGSLPNFSRMLKEGTVNQTFPSLPVWTPTNWATLSTGAHTGTHGASRWSVDVGDRRIDSFDGRAVNAERIWTALERKGLKGAALHYPAAFPSGAESSFIIDGFGHPGLARTEFEVAPCHFYTTAQLSGDLQTAHDGSADKDSPIIATEVPSPAEAKGWKNLPESGLPPLEVDLLLLPGKRNGKNIYAIAFSSGSGAYDRMLICRSKDGKSRIAELVAGEWSDWILEAFNVNGISRSAFLRFKLLELSENGKRFGLYRSQITLADGYTYPEGFASELTELFGPYQEHASLMPYKAGLIDFTTALEECEYQGLWFADVANYMLHSKDCSYFTCHWHLFDYINHIHLHNVDPVSPGYDPEQAEEKMDFFRRSYQVADRILGRLWEKADEESFVGVISDHGAAPDRRIVNLRKYLVKKGFLQLKNEGSDLERDRVGIEEIDWSKTKAYLKDEKGFDIYINAPEGPKFDEIERELLLALRTWVDEQAGCTPIAVVLPKKDAYILGQWGDQCGDVVFAWDHGYASGYIATWKSIKGDNCVGAPECYAAHHGGFLPTQTKLSSSFGTFIIAGPGLKNGYERPVEKLGYIHNADVVPICCHILGVDPPRQSQGAIAYDLYAGHEMEREREL